VRAVRRNVYEDSGAAAVLRRAELRRVRHGGVRGVREAVRRSRAGPCEGLGAVLLEGLRVTDAQAKRESRAARIGVHDSTTWPYEWIRD
jgi:hypothetical protein